VENASALIYGIARNKLKTFYGAKKKEFARDVTKMEEDFEYCPHYQSKSEHLIACAKQQLKPIDFDVVEMCVLCDFSRKRVAEELHMKIENVRQRLSRAVKS